MPLKPPEGVRARSRLLVTVGLLTRTWTAFRCATSCGFVVQSVAPDTSVTMRRVITPSSGGATAFLSQPTTMAAAQTVPRTTARLMVA